MRSLLLLLLACDAGPHNAGALDLPTEDSAHPSDSRPPEDSDPPADSPAVETAEPDTGDSAAPPVVEVETVPSAEDPSAWIFSADTIHVIDIRLDEAAINGLTADPYTYVDGELEFDGDKITGVGVRLKGKIGSFRTLADKAAFKIDLDRELKGREYYGIKKFNLNNMSVDCSYMKEHLGYRVLADQGVPALRTGWAWVTVNGSDYGLYNLLEHPDGDFLRQNYEDPSGNLYDGKYVWYGGYSYTLLDFYTSVQDLYTLEEGTDVSHVDIHNVTAAIDASAGTSSYYSTLGAYVDWDQVLAYLAWEQWVGHNDGYSLNTNNNFLYFDADDGKMEILPWDLDYAFLEDYQWGMNWATPRGRLAYYCMNDGGDCHAAWKAHAQDLVNTYDAAAYTALLDEIALVTADAIADDPRRECSAESVVAAQAAMYTWVSTRPDYLRSWWGL